jgi:hypothetical protein
VRGGGALWERRPVGGAPRGRGTLWEGRPRPDQRRIEALIGPRAGLLQHRADFVRQEDFRWAWEGHPVGGAPCGRGALAPIGFGSKHRSARGRASYNTVPISWGPVLWEGRPRRDRCGIEATSAKPASQAPNTGPAHGRRSETAAAP